MFRTLAACTSANVNADSGTAATAEARAAIAISSVSFSFPFPITYRPQRTSYWSSCATLKFPADSHCGSSFARILRASANSENICWYFSSASMVPSASSLEESRLILCSSV